MKIILLTTLTCFTLAHSYSQKVDIDNHRIGIEYASLPENFIIPEDRTYQVEISSGSYKFDKKDIENHLVIRGWDKKDAGAARIQVRLTGFIRGKSSYKKRVSEKKDKNGKVISKTNYYRYEVTNTGRADLRIYGPVNKYKDATKKLSKNEKEKQAEVASNPFLQNIDVSDQDKKFDEMVQSYDLSKNYSYATREFESIKAASDSYNRNISAEYANHLEDFNASITNRSTRYLNQFYGYNRKRDRAIFKRLDSTKHPEFEMYENAVQATETIFAEKRFNKSYENIAESMQPIIDYFEAILTNYGSKDKQHKKLKSASMYNIAQIYYYLDQPDKVIAIGEQFLRWGHDKKDGEKFIKKANELKSELAFHEMDGRFFLTGENAEDIFLENIEDEN